MSIEQELRKLLLPVFGLDSLDDIKSDQSLINDLGAESLDFVEIFHLIERKFGVEITANSLMVGGADLEVDKLFDSGKLTEKGLNILCESFSSKKDFLVKGMTKIDLYSIVTVSDLADIIVTKIQKKDQNASK